MMNHYNDISGVKPKNQNKIILVSESGKELVMQKGLYMIGRNLIDPANLNISENHFEINYNGNGKAIIEDTGSTNGTIINGINVSGRRHQVSNGDVIQIANIQLRVKLET